MKKTIYEYQIGVLIERGRFVSELKPGRVKYSTLLKKQSVEVYDTRPVFTTVADNCTTKDQITVNLSVNVSYAVTSPMLYAKTVNDAYNLVRMLVSDVLRDWVATLTLDEVFEKQGDLLPLLTSSLGAAAKEVGLTIQRISAPMIMPPRTVKQAMEAKLVATKKSQADLEEARGRTAVLRHYANAARMIDENPELLKLLLGQKAKSLQVQFTDRTQH